jgi:hypothetical protein
MFTAMQSTDDPALVVGKDFFEQSGGKLGQPLVQCLGRFDGNLRGSARRDSGLLGQ